MNTHRANVPTLDSSVDALMPRPLDPPTLRDAQRVIAAHSLDAQDAAELLRMLGLDREVEG